MTAAVYAARANLEVALIESDVCGGLVNSTYVVENFPSYISIHGMELMQKLAEQVLHLGVCVEEVAEVTNLGIAGKDKSIETEECIYQGGALILATGRQPVPLDVETDCRQIHYCSICDGSDYKGKRVLIVGGGNSGFDEALYLLSLGIREIILVEMMDRFFASERTREELFAHPGVTAHVSTRVKNVVCGGKPDRVPATPPRLRLHPWPPRPAGAAGPSPSCCHRP